MKKKDVEYSKRQLSAIVKLWFAGAPMGCGVVGYLIKSAMENREKIKQEYRSDYGEEELTYEDEKGE